MHRIEMLIFLQLHFDLLTKHTNTNLPNDNKLTDNDNYLDSSIATCTDNVVCILRVDDIINKRRMASELL